MTISALHDLLDGMRHETAETPLDRIEYLFPHHPFRNNIGSQY